MITTSASSFSLAASSPITYARQPSSKTNRFQSAGRFDIEGAPLSKSPKQTPSANSSGQITMNRTQAADQQIHAPIDETAIFYSRKDFTPLKSTTTTRVTSRSPVPAFKAELDSKKYRFDQYNRSDKKFNHGNPIAHRHRAFTVPEGNVDLAILDKKLTENTDDSVGFNESHTSDLSPKPTAQEWVSDIDCVSDIWSAMVADGDRGGAHL